MERLRRPNIIFEMFRYESIKVNKPCLLLLARANLNETSNNVPGTFDDSLDDHYGSDNATFSIQNYIGDAF